MSQRKTRKFMYIRWIYNASLIKEQYVIYHYVYRVIFCVFFDNKLKFVAIIVFNFDLQYAKTIHKSLSINLNSTIMFTIIVAIRLNEEMFDVARQLSTIENYVFEDNDFNDTMSSLNSLNDFYSLGNDTTLQLS